MMGARGWDDRLKRNATGLNRHRAFCLGMIFSENRYTLCANAARRIRIML
jgi:hypothetical protein